MLLDRMSVRCLGVCSYVMGVLLLAVSANAQSTNWDLYQSEGEQAYDQGRLSDAEQLFNMALEMVEGANSEENRLATTLNHLGRLYLTEGKYPEAILALKRSLAIREKNLPPDAQDVA